MLVGMYRRPVFARILERLKEPRRFLQVLAGPRQTGKTTLARQIMQALDIPSHYASADMPGTHDPAWIALQWEQARRLLSSSPLLVQRGVRESLAGRFELIPIRHWSYAEMRDAFGFSLEEFIWFGG